MTQTVERSESTTLPDDASPVAVQAPPSPFRSLRAAIVMAAGVAVAGLVIIAALVLIAWGAEKRSSASAITAVRAAGQAWLFAHHSPIGTEAGTIALVPIGLFALPLGLLVWAGVQVGRDIAPCPPLDAARAALAMAATYGVIAFLVDLGADTAPARIGALSAVLPAVLVAFAGSGAGIAVGAGLLPAVRRRLPWWLAACLRAALLAVCVPLAAGALLVAAALAADGGRVVALTGNLAVGIVGGVLLLILSILLAPNAIVCAAAYAVGPGFAIGTGTSVTLRGATLGPVPAYPLLAALPENRPSSLSWAVAAAPVLAGILAGAVLARTVRPRTWRLAFGSTLACGTAAGVLLGLLALAAGGPLGAGRLAAVGPSACRVGGAFAVEIAVVSAVSVVCWRWRALREAPLDNDDPGAIAQGPAAVDAPGSSDAADDGPETADEEPDEPEPDEPEPNEPEPELEAEEPDETEEPDEAESDGSESDGSEESEPAERDGEDPG